MKKFIEKIDFTANLDLMRKDLNDLVAEIGWPRKLNHDGKTISSNQIGLNHRPGALDQNIDNVGTLINQTLAREKDFTEFNKSIGEYTKNIILSLSKKENIPIGRVRYMRLEEKSGLTVHADSEIRYHLALYTNPNAFFGEKINDIEISAKCYHIPSDGYFYKVDTRREHFVFNGSREDRIHLVICTA